MVKVNYYKIPGFKNHEPNSKGIIYARSKSDVLEISKARGYKDKIDVEDIMELDYNSEIVTMFNQKELKAMRSRDKKYWKIITRKKRGN